ncbi:MAG: patatin-like phospholipase family protein, partial [Pseudomonadota bacterium]
MAALAAAALALMTPVASATEPDRPRIGLVLGGGGAAGVAHVGVVQALEDLGIRPDVIAGTSMGAIVGGLYAAGFTPEELKDAVTTIDWGGIFNDSSDRQLLHPLRRDSRTDPFSVQTDLPVGVGAGGIQVDAGLIDAVKLNLTLRRLFARAQGVSDFDDLPIPFRAIATDIVSGEAVVLGEGDLTSAVRASMSIPALFPPVEIEGRLLVDGGVVNNLPVDVARAMGADILIVSEIPGADVTPGDLRSFTAVLAQTMSVMIGANSRLQVASLGENDVLLVPDVQAVGMLAFEQAPSTVSAGREEVARQEAALRAIVTERAPLVARPAETNPLQAELRYDRLELDYDGRLDPRVIRARLDLPESGSVTIGALETALRRVYGLGSLDGVSYSMEPRDGEDVLVVQAKPVVAGRFQPRIGLGLTNVFGGDGDFNLALGFDVN